MEEIIDRHKLKIYFEFFHNFNSLFKSVKLSEDLVDELELSILKQTEDISEALTEGSQTQNSDSSCQDELLESNMSSSDTSSGASSAS